MPGPSPHEVTVLLQAWSRGDENALGKLVPLVYEDLRRAAQRYMVHERPAHTLQTTALVHEAYLRLVNIRRIDWQNRVHFLAICAQLMRRILIDFARSRRYQKRGGAAVRVSFEDERLVSSQPAPDLIALDDALKRLSVVDDRKARVVDLRFFGGLTVEETAEALNVSAETVMRAWKLAKSWLLRELKRNSRDAA